MELNSTWLIPAAALIVGIIIGFLIARVMFRASVKRTRGLDDMQNRFEAYQNEVVNHFNTTANLVKKLTQSYQDVQAHLTDAATRLALDEVTQQRMLNALHEEQKPAAREKLPAAVPETGPIEMPKDYAAKTDGPGMLDENYGLKSR